MKKRLSVAERLASTVKDQLLEDISRHDEWDRFLVEQAVLHFGEARDEFTCNQLRELLPDLGPGFLGAAINSLRGGGVIEHTGRMVPSTSGPTHGHRISVWRLTDKGRAIATQRRAMRNKQRRAAA
ncbi:hypothetical protein [Streptomyces himalayensis]|uniref:Uncharacterized protein n=1 Tax=Streptomyces himalayensis subsp. himalayensis TaxID=2756131 RepID=A0A7W0DUR4_9ACTN|nr:hypothetical protein [Streptomyces himalayensis]MBA2951637.1 hypothetical protein [Streptomyces himalayensis subsp. himalayensis]